MTIINPPEPETNGNDCRLSKYSNMSNEDLLKLQVFYLEKQAKDFEKFRDIVNRRLSRIEKGLKNRG